MGAFNSQTFLKSFHEHHFLMSIALNLPEAAKIWFKLRSEFFLDSLILELSGHNSTYFATVDYVKWNEHTLLPNAL